MKLLVQSVGVLHMPTCATCVAGRVYVHCLSVFVCVYKQHVLSLATAST